MLSIVLGSNKIVVPNERGGLLQNVFEYQSRKGMRENMRGTALLGKGWGKQWGKQWGKGMKEGNKGIREENEGREWGKGKGKGRGKIINHSYPHVIEPNPNCSWTFRPNSNRTEPITWLVEPNSNLGMAVQPSPRADKPLRLVGDGGG
jgi:hypothetical protein